jgi:Neocarzinostatin family
MNVQRSSSGTGSLVRRRGRRLRWIPVVSALALISALAIGSVIAEAFNVQPNLTVSQSSDLNEGQTIQVSGAHLTPGTYQLRQCNVSGACDPSQGQVTVDSSQTFPATPFVVHRSIANNAVACGIGNCVIVALDSTQTGGYVAINFAPIVTHGVIASPSTNLIDQQTVQVTGVGLAYSSTYQIEQCLQNAGSCDASTAVVPAPASDPNGNLGPVSFSVRRFITVQTMGGGTTQIDCRFNSPNCVIAAIGPQPSGVFLSTAQLAFAPALPPAPRVFLTPKSDVGPVGSTHTVTAQATFVPQPQGEPGGVAPGANIYVTVTGSVSAAGQCVTDVNGLCSFTYTGPLLPGADAITAAWSFGHPGPPVPIDPADQGTMAWEMPVTTAGQVTGGGQLAASVNGQVAFGFNAKSTNNSVKGECTVVDTAGADTKVKCLDATVMVQVGNTATFFGNATVNGVATVYRIDVTDNGEPGSALDTFNIVTASGYSTGGVIARGNIQVHS